MRIPDTPPNIDKIIADALKDDKEDYERIFRLIAEARPTDESGRYNHWQKIRFLQPPDGYSSEEWWAGIKTARRRAYKQTPFLSKDQTSFKFGIPDCVLRDLLELDQQGAGNISSISKTIASSQMSNTYLKNSLIKEAINSSQLEGASTTYKVAKEMLRQKRSPRDKSEQMIANNYQAMDFIFREMKGKPLSIELILELHKIVTQNTLDDPNSAGTLRVKDDIIVRDPRDGTVLHIPPKASELKKRIQILCKFANKDNKQVFTPPAIKSIILHFMLAYEHPFEDGNGRTARALFYWSMAKHKYWLIQYMSISQIIKEEFGQYARAFLHTETDENDLTYFIIHQLSVIKKALSNLQSYLLKKANEIESAKEFLEQADALKDKLNFRQVAILKNALENPGTMYTIKGHGYTHAIAYESARKDLMSMAEKYNLLLMQKSGRAYVFIAPENLKERIKLEKSKRILKL